MKNLHIPTAHNEDLPINRTALHAPLVSKRRAFMSYILGILLLAVTYKIWVQPLQNNLNELQLNYDDITAQSKVLQQNLKNELTMPLDKINKLTGNLALTAQDIHPSAVLKTLLALIKNQRLQLINLSPSLFQEENAAHSAAEAAHQNISLSLRGTYRQILKFFIALKSAEIIAVPTAFKLQTTQAFDAASSVEGVSPILKLDADVAIYALKQDMPSQRHINDNSIEKQVQDPFSNNQLSAERIKDDVNKASFVNSQSLTFFGTLKNKNMIWGIVSDDLGKIHYLKVGMNCGSYHSKIKKITQDAIITENESDNIYRTTN